MNNICFAHHKEKICKILQTEECPGTQCPFYKTNKDFKKSRRKAFGRLAKLDTTLQRYIAQTYYRGKMPWRKGGITCGR